MSTSTVADTSASTSRRLPVLRVLLWLLLGIFVILVAGLGYTYFVVHLPPFLLRGLTDGFGST